MSKEEAATAQRNEVQFLALAKLDTLYGGQVVDPNNYGFLRFMRDMDDRHVRSGKPSPDLDTTFLILDAAEVHEDAITVLENDTNKTVGDIYSYDINSGWPV